jgi:pyruvate carboxylase
MKMQTNLYSNADGIVEEIHVQVGDTVETKDLLVLLRA